MFAILPKKLAIYSVELPSCHLLLSFGSITIRLGIGEIKAAGTRSLHEFGFDSLRPWALKSKTGERECRTAFCYIKRHLCQGAVVHIWPEFVERFLEQRHALRENALVRAFVKHVSDELLKRPKQ